MKKILLVVLSLLLATAGMAAAEDSSSWLTIGGDYRFRGDWLKASIPAYLQITNPVAPLMSPGNIQPVPEHNIQNNNLLTNRFGINLKANPLEDVSVKARLVMYKVWGSETSDPYLSGTFMDRATNMDGTSGHIPQDNTVRVDYAYATVSNIFNAPVWFSIGRRPSTGGIPGNIRQNQEKIGTAGIPNIMVDYAFDGLSLGFAPDIEALPGSYMKLCYGKGFDAGFQSNSVMSSHDTIKDTDFIGINLAIIDTENIHAEVQWQRGMNLFDAPSDGFNMAFPTGAGSSTTTVNFPASANLGDIDWVGGVVMGKVAGFNLFLSAAQSKTDPKGSTAMFGNPDLTVGLLNNGTGQDKNTGYGVYVGGRYDIAATGTKLGAEYNHGSKYWIGFVPASDDVWTAKLGTRGDVYEIYLIQDLNRKAIAPKAKAFVRLGYQYYKFDYTGSNSWLGAPQAISDINVMNPMTAQVFPPVKDAKDLYLTFDVQF
jgi:hypothetical protein